MPFGDISCSSYDVLVIKYNVISTFSAEHFSIFFANCFVFLPANSLNNLGCVSTQSTWNFSHRNYFLKKKIFPSVCCCLNLLHSQKNPQRLVLSVCWRVKNRRLFLHECFVCDCTTTLVLSPSVAFILLQKNRKIDLWLKILKNLGWNKTDWKKKTVSAATPTP